MSTIVRILGRIKEKLLSLMPILATLSVIGGFILYGVSPKIELEFIRNGVFALAPILLPILIFTIFYTLAFVCDFLITIFTPLENENKNKQLMMILIIIISSILLYVVISLSWVQTYWQDATKHGDTDILGQITNYFIYATSNFKNFIIVLITEVLLTIMIVLSLKIVKEKNVKRFSSFLVKLEVILFLLGLGVFLFNTAQYTSLGAMIYYYCFGLFWVLFIPFLKVLLQTCPNCYKYNCGKTLLKTEYHTTVDHDNLKTVATEDVKIDGQTEYTINYVAPTVTEEAINTYKCNSCGKESTHLHLNLLGQIFDY